MFSRQKQILSKTVILTIIITITISFCCIANQGQKNYSEILKKSIHTGMTKGGNAFIRIDDSATGAFKDPNGIEFLIDVMINGPDWPNWMEEKGISPRTAQSSAARILGQIRDKKAFEPLVEMLKNGDFSGIRIAAAEALGSLGDKRAVGPLINSMENSGNDRIKIQSIRSLGILQSLDAVKPLIKALETSDNNSVKISAAYSLGQLKSLDAVKSLLGVLQNKNEDREVRRYCLDALTMIRDMRTLPNGTNLSN